MTAVQWWCSGVMLRTNFHQPPRDALTVDYAAQDLQAVDYATIDAQAIDYAAQDQQAVDYAAQDAQATSAQQAGAGFDRVA